MSPVEKRTSFMMDESTRAPRFQADFSLTHQLSQSLESIQIAQEFRHQYDIAQKENSALREEVRRLQSELVTAKRRSNVDQVQLQQDWSQCYFQQGSEVFSNAIAAIAWTNDQHDAIQLYVNQNNVLTELVSVNTVTPSPHAKAQWDRRFVFPGALMPNSTIAAATSFGLRHLIPASDPQDDRGRDVIRVFCFDTTETLREWIFDHTLGWRQTSLRIKGVDTKNVVAICWSEDGFAEWSLFYVTREVAVDGECQGGSLYEIRCSGGLIRQWSKPLEVEWNRGRGKVEEAEEQAQAPTTLQSSFSAFTNIDGSDRQIFYLNRSNPEVQVLKWGGLLHNVWLPLDTADKKMPQVVSASLASSFASMYMPKENWKRLFVHDGNDVVEWIGGGDDQWSLCARFSNLSTEGTMVAATTQCKGDKLRMYVFSIRQGRVVQTTFTNGYSPCWSSKAIVIRKL